MTPTISIIVIVKNDRAIASTLASLQHQIVGAPTETIVVDASLPTLMSDIRSEYPSVRWQQFYSNTDSKSSIPEQRNYGISHARGEVIVFIDANCVPDRDWLANLTRPILSGDEDITAGSVIAVDARTTMALNASNIKRTYLSYSPTINLAFMKRIWKEIGGFDETFLYGSDVDFTWRCIDAGYKIRFVQNARVTHDWGTFNDEIKRSIRYGSARARLLQKHVSRRIGIVGDDNVILFYSAWLAGLPLTLLVPWYPLTILTVVIKNRRGHPIKTVVINIVYTLAFYCELWNRHRFKPR